MWLISGGISLIIGIILIRSFIYIFHENQVLAKNYKGEKIPFAVGLIFPLGYIVSVIPLLISVENTEYLLKFCYLQYGFAVLGLLDDFLGNGTSKGLKGHLNSFFKKGVITTGFLKASFGLVIAFTLTLTYLDLEFNSLFILLLDVLIIALSANAINSLDLRPGRAGKIFLLVSIYFYLTTGLWEFVHIIPIILMVIIFLPGDLKGRYMLGDAGANALGAALGGYTAFFYDYGTKIYLLGALILFHIITESISLTYIIEKTPIISNFDKWGRD